MNAPKTPTDRLPKPRTTTQTEMQRRFVVMLPTIVKCARRAFCDYPAEARDDAVAEVIANSFVAFSRLAQRGKIDLAYPTVLARYGIAQFHAGRRTGVKLASREVYSRAEQRKADYRLTHIGSPGEQRGGWREMLCSSPRTRPSELAALRIDVGEWFARLPAFKRGIAERLAAGERTKDVACMTGISPGRVSQVRRELEHSWQQFVGEVDEPPTV